MFFYLSKIEVIILSLTFSKEKHSIVCELVVHFKVSIEFGDDIMYFI